MSSKRLKHLLVLTFSACFLLLGNFAKAQHEHENVGATQGEPAAESEKFEPGKALMEHILDGHEFHFATIGERHITIPLPVILYSPQRGWSHFSSAEFHHGHHAHEGYKLVEGHVVPVDATGKVVDDVKVYDLSLTRNVVQMILSLLLLVIVMTRVASKYRKNGNVAPSGFQGMVEPVIVFVRDEVGKANLGHQYKKYMPYLLTVFFFILINNIVGLIPGSANVTGNIAFTLVLGVISFLVIVFSGNKHFWGHIFNPPVPVFVKPILALVEILSIFTKPFALIIRLFANMVAGHMMITLLILLIFIFGAIAAGAGYGFAPLSVAFTCFIYLIEVLVAFIQAFIFTNLTAVFIGQAIEGDHHDGHDTPNAVFA
jgi:F-type H+-transporting ATPase subunit a